MLKGFVPVQHWHHCSVCRNTSLHLLGCAAAWRGTRGAVRELCTLTWLRHAPSSPAHFMLLSGAAVRCVSCLSASITLSPSWEGSEGIAGVLERWRQSWKKRLGKKKNLRKGERRWIRSLHEQNFKDFFSFLGGSSLKDGLSHLNLRCSLQLSSHWSTSVIWTNYVGFCTRSLSRVCSYYLENPTEHWLCSRLIVSKWFRIVGNNYFWMHYCFVFITAKIWRALLL